MIIHTVRHSLYSTPDGSLTSTYITHGIKWYRMYHDMENLLCICKRWKWYVCIWTVQLPELILFVTSDNLQSLLLYMSAPLSKSADSMYHYHYSGYFLWFAISNVAGAWPRRAFSIFCGRFREGTYKNALAWVLLLSSIISASTPMHVSYDC